MRVLCVARHRFLSEHLATWFGALGVDCSCAVGLDAAVAAAASLPPDVVLCEYELLATASLHAWEADAHLSRVPVLAVSLTHRPAERVVLDQNSIAGFLYLPMLDASAARRILAAAARPAAGPPASYSLPSSLEWTRATPTAP